jgi:ketosteroid isomerase-like protein
MNTKILSVPLAMLILLLVSACAPAAGQSPAASPDMIVKSYVESANSGDFDKTFAFYADDAVVKLNDGRVFTGKEEIAKWLQEDVKTTRSAPKDFSVSGDVVTVHGMVTLARFEPLGINPLAYDLTVVVKDGKIALFIPKLLLTPEQQAKIAEAAAQATSTATATP